MASRLQRGTLTGPLADLLIRTDRVGLVETEPATYGVAASIRAPATSSLAIAEQIVKEIAQTFV